METMTYRVRCQK